jgi:hypothetical protein
MDSNNNETNANTTAAAANNSEFDDNDDEFANGHLVHTNIPPLVDGAKEHFLAINDNTDVKHEDG